QEVEPSKAPPSLDYVPSSPIRGPASPDYHPGSENKSEPFEDESEPTKDAPEVVEPLPAQVAPPSVVHLPPPDVPSPQRRSSQPPSDTTVEAVITEFVIPEATTIVALVRRRWMIYARRWTFARDDIDTSRHQKGEPRYEIEEGFNLDTPDHR
nr:hypothetical protein [Tanacetum cinerariifolium]